MASKNKGIKPGRALLIGGGALGAILLISKFFSDVKQSGTSEDDVDDRIDPGKRTWDIAMYSVFCDTIQAAIWGTGFLPQPFEDDDIIGSTLMKMRTLTDVYQLIDTWGVRGRGVLLVDAYNLPEAIEEFLDEDTKQEVNEDYRRKKINFQWP